MPRRKEDEPLRPSEKYIALLHRMVEEYGVRPEDVDRTKMTHSRFFGEAKSKTQTLSMANRYAAAVRSKGGHVPPAWVPVVDGSPGRTTSRRCWTFSESWHLAPGRSLAPSQRSSSY